MTRAQVPVDEALVESVTEEEWAETPTPLRVLVEEARGNERSRAAFDAAQAEIGARMESLRQLREARALTQATIGELLGMTQSEVSRLERRSDMLLSTLRRFVQASGGDLTLVVRFPNSSTVELNPHYSTTVSEVRDDAVRAFLDHSTPVVRSLPPVPEETLRAIAEVVRLFSGRELVRVFDSIRPALGDLLPLPELSEEMRRAITSVSRLFSLGPEAALGFEMGLALRLQGLEQANEEAEN